MELSWGLSVFGEFDYCECSEMILWGLGTDGGIVGHDGSLAFAVGRGGFG
jgi:hypothetical protein